jgi:hypothetical protein
MQMGIETGEVGCEIDGTALAFSSNSAARLATGRCRILTTEKKSLVCLQFAGLKEHRCAVWGYVC